MYSTKSLNIAQGDSLLLGTHNNVNIFVTSQRI